MSTDPSTPENDANLSALGRELLDTGSSKPSGPWVPPTAEELHKLLPEYEIVKMLGRGGMGAVYMGKQISLDRPVAIKILSNALEEADASFAERFKNEAKAMGKLSHPGIVAVHDFGETAGGLLYIVMEYVEGTDVARMIAKSGRLHTDHAMAITAHVCDALGYAHDRGIIHRDIKPANIMVGYDGVVKVADFGLAKMTQSPNTGLTQSGMAMGTLHYMAPEALMLGSGVDHRADIYAVGVMLYQMLTGKIPQGMFELPSLQVSGLDPRYDGIIAKSLREDREKRYQSVGEMRGDLDGILTQPVVKVEEKAEAAPPALPTQARPQRPVGKPYRQPKTSTQLPTAASKSPHGWLVWTVLGLSMLGGGYVWLNRSGQGDSPVADNSLTNASTITPSSATQDAPFTNSLGMKFVPVPGTQVLFCIHETRRQDYAAYAAEVPGVEDSWENQQCDGIPVGDQDDHPVVSVTWDESAAFCAWLSKKEGKTYRLPTDEEWSIAVGLGSKEQHNEDTTPEMFSGKEGTKFPWGGDFPPKTQDQAGNYSDSAWHEKVPSQLYIEGYTDGFPTTAPVMSFRPNNLGLYDMGGNVWEWIGDWWNAAQSERVFRGGGFVYSVRGRVLSSYRAKAPPSGHAVDRGFRCVLSAEAAPSAVDAAATPAPGAVASLSTAQDAPFTNTLGMKFVPVPDTEVLFCIHETRRQDYAAYATEVPAVDESWKNQKRDGIPCGDKDDHPVVGVRWEDAQAFCAWLGKKDGRAYRLPTDEEWSIAVGLGRKEKRSEDTTPEMLSGKETTEFPWGGDYPPKTQDLAGNYADSACHEKLPTLTFIKGYMDGFPTTAPVMSFKSNKLGLYDMGGNVLELVEDWWNAEQKERVFRGASFPDHGSGFLLSSRRYHYPPGRRPYCGFRCVVSAGSTPSAVAPAQPSVSTTTPAFDLQQLPDFRTRIANYQRARHAQLSELSGKYRNALTAARAQMVIGGVLAEVTALDDAITRATALADEIEKNLSSLEVKPLSALPDLSPTVPQRLKDLRTIFDRETAKIESTLVASLDQSLATVQASLVQATNLEAAKTVEDYRKQMMAAFEVLRVEPTTAPQTATPASIATSSRIDGLLGNGQWQNLLPIIDQATKDTQGTWKYESGVLKCTTSTENAFCSIATEPLEAYSVRVRFAAQGNKHVAVFLPTTAGGMTFGLIKSTKDVRLIETRKNSDIRQPQNYAFSDGKEHEWLIHVSATGLESTFDGLPLFNMPNLKWKEVQQPDDYPPTKPFGLGVGVNNGTAEFHSFEILIPSAVGKKSAGSSPTTPTSQGSNSPASATKDKPFENSLGMKFVPVPGTNALMCIHETRRRDFVAFATDKRGAGQSWQSAAYQALPVGAEDDHPVVMVSWEACADFCDWLTQKSRIKHRLPTDREWSLAVGIGDREDASKTHEELKNMISGVWPYGMQYPPATKVGNYADQAFGAQFPGERILNGYADGFAGTAPVMSFPPNTLGIYDLGGNVWEWCQDLYDGAPHFAVTRGAAFNDAAELWMRSSHRAPRKKEQAHPTVGLRCVIELP